MSKANQEQIGGGHYKVGGEEHWDRQYRLYGHAYFVGCITKYVERFHKKNGVEDLLKAKHFLEKLIELERRENPVPVPVPVENAPRSAGIPPTGRYRDGGATLLAPTPFDAPTGPLDDDDYRQRRYDQARDQDE